MANIRTAEIVANKKQALKELQTIPGVGKTIAQDLLDMGFWSVRALSNQNAEVLYIMHNDHRGAVQDICMLYTFRCAIYFANTEGQERDAEKLKWWNWMDKEKMSSIEKDSQIRSKCLSLKAY